MNPDKPISIATRLTTMFLDYVFVTIFIVILFFIVFLSLLALKVDVVGPETEPAISIMLLSLFTFYFNKDAIAGKSLAKRIFGLVIVNSKTGQIANPLRLFVRNLTMLLWPVELLFAFVSPHRRLGDYISGTKLVVDNRSSPGRSNIAGAVFCVIVGMLMLALTAVSMESLTK